MADIADLVKQKETDAGDSIAAKVRQRELTHEGSGSGATEEQELKLKYGPLESPGLEDFGLRADISTSRNLESKSQKFQSAYPYGELHKDEDTGILLFRKTPTEEWQKVDAGMFEKFELGDIADLVGDIPAIAGEIITTKGAAKPVSMMGRAAIGAGAGDIARSASEQARGFETPEFAQSAATEGLLGAGGEAAGLGVRGLINAGRGAGAVTPAPFVRKTMKEANRRGLPQLHPGQVSENPVFQAFARQSRALSGKIHQYERTQEGAALDLLEGMRKRGEIMPLGKDLETALARRESEITRKLKARPPGQRDPGKALKEGLEGYRDMSGRVVSHSYTEARQLHEPGFDIEDVLSKADETEQGVRALLEGTETTVPSSIVDEAGNPLGTFVIKEEGGTRRVSEVPGDLLKVIKELKQIDAAALKDARIARDAGADAPFDVLKELRTQLFDLQNPVDGVIRNEHRLAGGLYRELTESLKNPLGDAGGAFLTAWGKATGLASKRFETLEQEYISKALRTHKGGDVEGLFRSLFRPNNANQLKFVRETLAKHGMGKWNDFKAGAISDLVSDPQKMWQTLKSFDNQTLKEIFTEPEIDGLKTVAYQFQRLDKAGIREATQRQTQANAVVADLINGMNTAGADELFKMSGGKNTPLGQKLRAGIVEWVYDRALERTKHGPQINRKSIISSVSKLKQAGMLKFLTNEDKRALHVLLPDYLALIRSLGTDTGESIRRAAIIQKLTDRTTEAVFDILEEVAVGRVMTSKWGHDLIYGVGRKQWNLTTLRRFSAALAIMADDYEREQPPQ